MIPDFDSIFHLVRDPVLPAVRHTAITVHERSPIAVVTRTIPVVIPSLVYTPRQVTGFRYLSEARRIELLLLPRMAYETVHRGASNRNSPEYHIAQGLWTDAIAEVIAGLSRNEVEKLGRRMNRVSDGLYHAHRGGYFDENWSNAKIAMTLFFTACDLTSDGTLELHEGSAAADALRRLWSMVEDEAGAKPGLVRSAEKQAAKFRQFLSGRGYFVP